MNFWEKLSKPIFILAPMDGVTDTVFRQIVASVGKPDVFFTEFVPVDAILSKGNMEISKSLQYSEIERPIVAQIWGSDPKKFYKVAKLLYKLGFDGIDINMGCPDRSAIKKGACSALIKNPKLAREIILATVKGACGVPVSVKTRIGFDSIDTKNWVKVLLQTPIAALTVHLRTVAEMSKVPAHWDEMEKITKVKDTIKSKAKIFGNGNVKSLKEARDRCSQYGIDGVMIGTGIFENVYLFNEKIDVNEIGPKQKIELLLKHIKLFEKTWGQDRHFELLKKFVKCYVNNFNGAKEHRDRLMKTKTLPALIEEVAVLSKES
ncbi:tRNA-dihydrouridine synthase [Candidatus Daviesbacteria bacterium]|nr:tRNA-dihydrouridine synthase [Candidatus Daviesbacteria bacterium]